MALELVDSHCHLTWNSFDPDRPEVIARAVAAGVTRLVTIGADLESSRQCVALAHAYPGVYAAAGVHPNDLGEQKPGFLAELAELAADPRVVAIGEIGLD